MDFLLYLLKAKSFQVMIFLNIFLNLFSFDFQTLDQSSLRVCASSHWTQELPQEKINNLNLYLLASLQLEDKKPNLLKTELILESVSFSKIQIEVENKSTFSFFKDFHPVRGPPIS